MALRAALLCGLSWAFAEGQSTTSTTTVNLGLPQYDEINSQDQEVNAAERLDIFDASSWAVPARVGRCPVHQAATASVNAGKVEMDTTFNITKMYSILEGQIPQSAISGGLAKYDGLEMHFFNKNLQHFKVRVSDDRTDARFIAAVKANGDGEHNLWLKWSDFHGEELMMGGIRPCTENAPCRNINHGSIKSVAILIPMVQDAAYGESKFTIERITLDVLATGGQNSTDSTQVKPASEAQEIRFEEPDVMAMNSARSQGACFVAFVSMGLGHFLL